MNAMIFAAGLGTRLRPLTDTMPKAMVPFMGKPLLWHAIKSVEKAGARKVVVNVHHFADKIIDYLKSEKWNSEIVISDEKDKLLDTGGGIVNALPLFNPDEPVIIRNADIVTSFELNRLVESHKMNNSDATLLVMHRQSSRYLIFDDDMRMCGWKNVNTGEKIMFSNCTDETDLGFCGIHVINYDYIRAMGDVRKFSIIEGYLSTGKQRLIKGLKLENDIDWFDVGSVTKLNEAEEFYKNRK
ncbi:MAG: nucleotidyltransferase family protein [Chlorobi bacterium]|nr:nucleotidyltransferase family protein [Chlorobiota bacterium]